MRILLMSIFIGTLCLAQNSKIDSLKKLNLENSGDKFAIFNELGWQYAALNPDSLAYFHNLSAKFVRNENQKSRYLNLQATLDFLKQDFSSSQKNIQLSNTLAIKNKDYKTISSNYNTLAKIEYLNGRYNEAEKLMKAGFENIAKTNDRRAILKSIINYGSVLIENNKTKEGVALYQKAENYFGKNTEYEQGFLYSNLARALINLKDFNLSKEYFKKALAEFNKIENTSQHSEIYLGFAEIYLEEKNMPQVKRNLDFSKKYLKNEIDETNYRFILANYHQLSGNLNEAYKELSKSIAIDEALKNESKLGEDYLLMGDILLRQKKYSEAIGFLNKAKKLFETQDDPRNLQSNYQKLIWAKLAINNDSELLRDFRKLDSLNISLFEADKQQAIYDLSAKYKNSEKEAKIKTQQLELVKEKNHRNLALGGVGLLAMFLIGGFAWNRNRQKRKAAEQENVVLQLKNNLQQMELSTLNKQLNPHEFKNLLMGLAPDMQQKSPETYQKMTGMIKLLNSTLANSSFTESLETQIEQIEAYLDLEKSTINVPLSYEIQNEVSDKNIQIPRLLLKNLVENSIKHGIKPKSGGGDLKVKISDSKHEIRIKVEDTGIGMKNFETKDSGIGTSTYQNLFKILNKKNEMKASFDVENQPIGMAVKISIPKNYNYKIQHKL